MLERPKERIDNIFWLGGGGVSPAVGTYMQYK